MTFEIDKNLIDAEINTDWWIGISSEGKFISSENYTQKEIQDLVCPKIFSLSRDLNRDKSYWYNC